MITLRVESQQFAALGAGIDAAASDAEAPIERSLITRVRTALFDGEAAALPGLPILVLLKSTGELDTLVACFEVGGECHPDVTDDQWCSVMALLEQAVRTLGFQVAN